MVTTIQLPGIILVLAAFGQPPLQAPVPAELASSRPGALVEFRARVDAYVALRNEIARHAPPTRVATADVAKLERERGQFAQGLRKARGETHQGEIFTPAITAELRRLLFEQLSGQWGPSALEVMSDDAPVEFALAVNAAYPDGEPLATMSPGVLLRLPALPMSLEYRFVGPHLLLRDVDANIIVDFITDAIRLDPTVPFRVIPIR